MGQVVRSTIDHKLPKREQLRQLIAERCFKKGRFVLASGRTSDFYFNLKPAMLDPEGINLLADLVLEKIAETDAKYIGGLVMGAVPIAIAAVMKSVSTSRPLQAFWVRKEAKGHGTNSLADGYLGKPGEKVVIVDDVTTTGDSIMQAIKVARDSGSKIAAVITVVDRLEGAKEKLASEGYELIALFDTKDFA